MTSQYSFLVPPAVPPVVDLPRDLVDRGGAPFDGRSGRSTCTSGPAIWENIDTATIKIAYVVQLPGARRGTCRALEAFGRDKGLSCNWGRLSFQVLWLQLL